MLYPKQFFAFFSILCFESYTRNLWGRSTKTDFIATNRIDFDLLPSSYTYNWKKRVDIIPEIGEIVNQDISHILSEL